MSRLRWFRPALALALVLAVLAAAPASAASNPGPGASVELVAPPPRTATPAVTFDEAVHRALARNPTALVARQEVERARALLWEGASASLPNLTAGGSRTLLDSARALPNGVVIIARDTSLEDLNLSVPLLAPSSWFAWVHRHQSLDAARAGEAEVRRTVAVATAQSFLAVLASQDVLRVARSALDTARAHHDYAVERRRGGLGTALDELRAEQELAASDVQVEQAAQALTGAREALGVLAGDDGPLDADGPPPLAPPSGVDLERRDDVRAARARAYAAGEVARDSWADWIPTVLGTAEAFHQNPPSLTMPANGWQVQLVLSFPLFEGGLRIGQARERAALAAESSLQVEALLRQASSEVRATWEALEHARAAAASSRRGADAAASALDLATTAFQAGTATSLDVVDAEKTARDSAIAAVIAARGVQAALVDLLAATGHFP